jgi:lysylphosphatidylglycerol synthetase-like protein (DUF2156 family)
VGEKFKAAVEDIGFSSIRIGDDFLFDAATYAPKGDKTKMIRLARNHSAKSGATVKEYDPRITRNPALEKTFEEIAQRWIHTNNRFKAHILELDLFVHPEIKRYFYAEVAGNPVAFVTCLPIYGRNGLLFEDAIRDPCAPYGAIEMIVLAIVETLRKESGSIATFGLSPKLDISTLGGPSWLVAVLGVWFANRIFGLRKLYHFRKKFYTSVSESSYLLKYPKGIGFFDLVKILTSF